MLHNQEAPPFVARRIIRGRYMFSPRDGGRRSGGLRVVCAGFEECKADYQLRRPTFPYPALEVIAGGEWELSSEGRRWRLGPGMIFTYGPGVSYTLRALSKRGLRKFFVDFEGAKAAPALRGTGLQPPTPSRLAHPRWLQDLIEQLIDTARMDDPTREGIGNSLAGLIVQRLAADLNEEGHLPPAAWHAFQRCRDHLAANYLEIESLSGAARACGVTHVHLCRLFARFAGESPHRFITRMQMNHAAELIVRGNVAVKEAASEVGYADPAHFSRVFKKVCGSPPSRFLKRTR